MTLEGAANKIQIAGHAGIHPETCHLEMFRRLRSATHGFSCADLKEALLKKLEVISGEATTVGSSF